MYDATRPARLYEMRSRARRSTSLRTRVAASTSAVGRSRQTMPLFASLAASTVETSSRPILVGARRPGGLGR